jgi:hypothetical protein
MATFTLFISLSACETEALSALPINYFSLFHISQLLSESSALATRIEKNKDRGKKPPANR